MDSDVAGLANEVKSKVILHWNCRGFIEFPEVLRFHGSHIREIYLKWNKLTTLPPWIVELNVTNLYMYDNLIKQLPAELGRMSQLTVLDLSANRLEHIPTCICNLSNLKSLYLNGNFIEKLPNELSRLNSLEELSVSDNRIVALPEWIGSLPNLKYLYADNNELNELPNRLTLAPKLAAITVRSNRLRYLPLNGFLSAPFVRFSENEHLNYMSYPLLFQLLSQLLGTTIIHEHVPDFGCFKTQYDTEMLNANIKLYVQSKGLYEKNSDAIVVLPRQLLKIHEIHENATCSLLELALRKVYTERYKHTLDVSTSPSVTIFYSPFSKNGKLDIALSSTNHILYNLLTNGPTSICVNSHCQQSIFTEAWIIIGISCHAESIITIALCCTKSCASAFAMYTNTITKLHWHSIDR